MPLEGNILLEMTTIIRFLSMVVRAMVGPKMRKMMTIMMNMKAMRRKTRTRRRRRSAAMSDGRSDRTTKAILVRGFGCSSSI